MFEFLPQTSFNVSNSMSMRFVCCGLTSAAAGWQGLPTSQHGYGQRPSVILRGNHTKCNATTPDCWPQFRGVDSTYLVRFDRCVFSGGAVQYQQITMGEQVRPRPKLRVRLPMLSECARAQWPGNFEQDSDAFSICPAVRLANPKHRHCSFNWCTLENSACVQHSSPLP